MKRILVTGGTRGIGRAVVERLLRGGMAAVTVVSEENEPHRWEELEALGPVWHHRADLSIAEASGEAVRSATAYCY